MDKRLRQIADMLLLDGTLTECPGVIHGKMGIAVFFFHYAQYTANMLFADYAMDLIGEMQAQIHNNSSADYERGIAGIGVGIDYFVSNDFLDADENIFEDFDQRMYRAVMYDPWQDFSLYNGLTGYGRYWFMRFQQASSDQSRKCLLQIAEFIVEKLPDISAKEQIDVYCFLYELQKISGFDVYAGLWEQCKKWDIHAMDVRYSFSRLGYSAVGIFTRHYQLNRYFKGSQSDIINVSLEQLPDMDMDTPPADMGLLNGYAGAGMLHLTALNKANTSWMNLL